jgi:hypothetical protein
MTDDVAKLVEEFLASGGTVKRIPEDTSVERPSIYWEEAVFDKYEENFKEILGEDYDRANPGIHTFGLLDGVVRDSSPKPRLNRYRPSARRTPKLPA